MKSPKTYLDAFQFEQKSERTDRVARELVEEAATERREKSRLLRQARLERKTAELKAELPAQPHEKGDES